MKLKQLTLTNFRCFDKLEIDFHDQLTVLIAPNGAGKTTVLDAVSVVLSSFVGAFDLGKAHGFALSDARYALVSDSDPTPEQQYPVEVCASFSEPDLADQSRLLSGPKNRTTVKDVAKLVDFGKQLMSAIREKDVELPVIAYYPTGRLWKQHKLMERKKITSASRSMGYEDCLSSASSYLQMQIWMKSATFASLQEKQMPDAYPTQSVSNQLSAVKKAVETVLEHTGWHNFHYSITHDELAMQHNDLGILPVSLLSDGVRAMVSMAADLAWRCVKLNSARAEKAPETTSGIVLIDEVDMHLHPEWQQQVVGSLTAVFKRVQFVLTTHSPQVISTIHSDCIRILDHGAVYNAPPGSKGAESTRMLKRLFQTEPRSVWDGNAKMLREYEQMVYDDDWDTSTAEKLRAELDKMFAGEEPKLTELDEYIANRKWERDLEEDS